MELFRDEQKSVQKWKIVSWQEGRNDYLSVILILILIAVMVWRFVTLNDENIGHSLFFENNTIKVILSKVFVVLTVGSMLANLKYVFRDLIICEETYFRPMVQIGKIFWGYASGALFFAVISCGAFGGKMLWFSLVLMIFLSVHAVIFCGFYLFAVLVCSLKKKLDKAKMIGDYFNSLQSEQEKEQFYQMYLQRGKIRRWFARIKYRFK